MHLGCGGLCAASRQTLKTQLMPMAEEKKFSGPCLDPPGPWLYPPGPQLNPAASRCEKPSKSDSHIPHPLPPCHTRREGLQVLIRLGFGFQLQLCACRALISWHGILVPCADSPMRKISIPVRWGIAALISCTIVQATACAVLLSSQAWIAAALFGFHSLSCVVLTVCVIAAHALTAVKVKPGPSTRSSGLSADLFNTGSNTGVRVAFDDKTENQSRDSIIDHDNHDNHDPVRPLGSSKLLAWSLVLIIVAADVLWALCGVRSFWFVISLGLIPTQPRGPIVVIPVGLLTCTALLSTATWLRLGPTESTLSLPLVLQILVLDAASALLPSLLLLMPLFSTQPHSDVYGDSGSWGTRSPKYGMSLSMDVTDSDFRKGPPSPMFRRSRQVFHRPL